MGAPLRRSWPITRPLTTRATESARAPASVAGPFWEAEPEHQDYLERNPGGYTCHFIRSEWKLPARQQTSV